MNIVRRALSLVTLGALLGAPLAAGADTTDRTYNLDTRIVDPTGAGEYDGTLQLRISDGGIVNGYYRPNGERYISVSGGVDPQGKLWLSIGSFESNPTQFTGTLKDGKIEAAAFIHGRSYDLTGTPKPA